MKLGVTSTMLFKTSLIHSLVLLFLQDNVSSLEISPKVMFTGSNTNGNLKSFRDVEVFTPMDGEPLIIRSQSPEQSPYTKSFAIKQNHDQFSDEVIEQEHIICKNKKCVHTLGNEKSDSDNKAKKVSTDVHVIISTDLEDKDDSTTSKKKKTENTDDNDVPVVQGFKGVRPQDINWKEIEKQATPKNDKEQPSSIITSPYSGNPVIINGDSLNKPQKPVNHLIPPYKPPVNWRGSSERRTIYSDTNPVFRSNYPDTNQHKNNGGYDANRGVRLPSGWSSNWRPINPLPHTPGDYYHYNVNDNGRDISGWGPRFQTVCTCSKQLVQSNSLPRQIPGRPARPWYNIETTTKAKLDDKLSPQFSADQ